MVVSDHAPEMIRISRLVNEMLKEKVNDTLDKAELYVCSCKVGRKVYTARLRNAYLGSMKKETMLIYHASITRNASL